MISPLPRIYAPILQRLQYLPVYVHQAPSSDCSTQACKLSIIVVAILVVYSRHHYERRTPAHSRSMSGWLTFNWRGLESWCQSGQDAAWFAASPWGSLTIHPNGEV